MDSEFRYSFGLSYPICECAECPCLNEEWTVCDINEREVTYGKKPSWCPLKEEE